MMKFIRYSVLCSCFLMVFSVSVHADDEVKRLIGGLAVGIVGHVLDNAEQQSQQQNNTQPASLQSSKPKLQYSKDVADVQKKLKMIGYYDGVVDGLKGQNTIDAMNRFEEIYSSQVDDGAIDANITNDEMVILDKLVDNLDAPAVADTTDENRPKKISEIKGMKSQGALYKDIKNMVFYYKSGEACIDYKNQTGVFGETNVTDKFNGQYRQYLDEDLKEYVFKAKSLEKKRFRVRAGCNDISEQTLDGLYERAEQEYNGSNMKINLTSGSLAIIQGYPDVEEQFVDECNVYAHKLKKEYKKMVSEKEPDACH